ncbi:MAG: FeoA family protein [Peptococcaceae bacterium]|nr:FeoA family protein [Peptococcaceae bacterium]
MAEEITLDQIPIGSTAIIRTVGGKGVLRRRLLDMGLTPNTKVTLRKTAPMGDPVELYLRGYSLTLRKEEGAKITVEVIGDDLCPDRQPKQR